MGKLRRWLLLPMTTTAKIDDVDGGVRKRSVMTYVPPVAMWRLRMEVMAVEVFGKWRWVEIAMPHNSTETVLPKVVGGGDYSYEDHPCSLVLWWFVPIDFQLRREVDYNSPFQVSVPFIEVVVLALDWLVFFAVLCCVLCVGATTSRASVIGLAVRYMHARAKHDTSSFYGRFYRYTGVRKKGFRIL
jgi:hypothetical protein